MSSRCCSIETKATTKHIAEGEGRTHCWGHKKEKKRNSRDEETKPSSFQTYSETEIIAISTLPNFDNHKNFANSVTSIRS